MLLVKNRTILTKNSQLSIAFSQLKPESNGKQQRNGVEMIKMHFFPTESLF